MNPETDFEPDKPSIKTKETYPDYVADYDSNLGEFQSVKDEHRDGVNQVKTENQLVVEVKSEPSVDNMKFENVDTLTLNDDIKCEYDKDAISDSTCDRIKIEEKFLPGIEADWTAGTADQIEMGFQSFEKLEKKPPLNYENTDALELHQEFDIKTEGDQNDGHDSASDSAQIRKTFKRNHKFFIIHVKRKNSCLGSNLEKTQSVSGKLCEPNEYSTAPVPSKIHQCTYCDYKTAFKPHFTGHMSMHSNTKVSDLHICKYCNASFNAKKSLLAHILKKHSNFCGTVSSKKYEWRHTANHNSEKPFECSNCDAAFKSKMLLDNHVIRKHAESIASVSSKIHECGFCDYKTAVKRYLTKHMLIHNDNKVSELHVCRHCNESFKATQSLVNHILKKHPNFSGTVSRKIYECMHCAYKLTNRGGFITHMATHNSQTPFACINCDSVFKSKVLLDNHVIRKHAESIASVSSEIYECRFCDYKTVIKRYLTKHLLIHNDNKVSELHVCKHCNASFKAKESLFDHIVRKHPLFSGTVSRKIYKCMHCAFKTTSRSNFIKHMAKHNSRPRFACINCDSVFKNKVLLDYHVIRKHSESIASVSSKIYECTFCDYKTVVKRYLTAHMLIHNNEIPDLHVCKHCNACFKEKQSFLDHILKKHPDFNGTVSSKKYEYIHRESKTTGRSSFLSQAANQDSNKPFECINCDAAFKSKMFLDNHLIRKHAESVASVSSKIHECPFCDYNTVVKRYLTKHMLIHNDDKVPDLNICKYCNASFKTKTSLLDHISEKHPNFSGIVSSKKYECIHCEYKTNKKE